MDDRPNDRLSKYRSSEPPSSTEDVPTPEIYIVVNQDSFVKLSMESYYDEQVQGDTECNCNAVSVCTCNKVCTCHPQCACEAHRTCSCVGYSSGGTVCTCDLVCTCVPVT